MGGYGWRLLLLRKLLKKFLGANSKFGIEISSKNHFLLCLQHSDWKELEMEGPHGLIQRRNTEGSISSWFSSEAYVSSSLSPQGAIRSPEQEGETSTLVLPLKKGNLISTIMNENEKMIPLKKSKSFHLFNQEEAIQEATMQDGEARGEEATKSANRKKYKR